MRVAIAVEGTRGDVFPMLALARALLSRGHDVRLCGPPDFADDAADPRITYHPVGPAIRPFMQEQAATLGGGALAVARAGERFLRQSMETHFRQLPDALEGAELVIAAGTQMVAASAAEAVGARYHYVAYYPAFFPTASAPPAFLPWQRLPAWLNRLAWRLGDGALRRALLDPMSAGRNALGLPPRRDLVGLVIGSDPLLATEPALAPPPDDTPVAPRCIGCLHPFEEEPLPEKLESFLAAGDPPVYVGFGSMPDPNPRLTTAVVLEAADRAGLRLVLSEGWAGLGDIALPATATTVGAVSHAALFRRVAAVVHHGGAGTTTTAARAGVPQVVVPHLLDQFWWSQRVYELGLGAPPLPRRRLDPRRLSESLLALRDNEILAERAGELGARLRRDLRERDDAASLLT